MLLTGYTEDYWILKNEWGESWGEDGYIRITRNRDYNCYIGSQLFKFVEDPCDVLGCKTCD